MLGKYEKHQITTFGKFFLFSDDPSTLIYQKFVTK